MIDTLSNFRKPMLISPYGFLVYVECPINPFHKDVLLKSSESLEHVTVYYSEVSSIWFLIQKLIKKVRIESLLLPNKIVYGTACAVFVLVEKFE